MLIAWVSTTSSPPMFIACASVTPKPPHARCMGAGDLKPPRTRSMGVGIASVPPCYYLGADIIFLCPTCYPIRIPVQYAWYISRTIICVERRVHIACRYVCALAHPLPTVRTMLCTRVRPHVHSCPIPTSSHSDVEKHMFVIIRTPGGSRTHVHMCKNMCAFAYPLPTHTHPDV